MRGVKAKQMIETLWIAMCILAGGLIGVGVLLLQEKADDCK